MVKKNKPKPLVVEAEQLTQCGCPECEKDTKELLEWVNKVLSANSFEKEVTAKCPNNRSTEILTVIKRNNGYE